MAPPAIKNKRKYKQRQLYSPGSLAALPFNQFDQPTSNPEEDPTAASDEEQAPPQPQGGQNPILKCGRRSTKYQVKYSQAFLQYVNQQEKAVIYSFVQVNAPAARVEMNTKSKLQYALLDSLFGVHSNLSTLK